MNQACTTFEVDLIKCSLIKEYYNATLFITLKNKNTDTDFYLVMDVKFSDRDLQYVSDNIQDMICNRIHSFGFVSCDKVLSFYMELSSEGVSHQIEIRKSHSKTCYCLNINSNVLFLEHLMDVLSSVKNGVDNIVDDYEREQIVPLSVRIIGNSEPSVYSLCLSMAGDSVVRSDGLRQDDVELLKGQLSQLLNGDIASVNITGDNLFLSIYSFGTEFLIDGEISDFTFPQKNKIKFYDGVSIDRNTIKRIIA